MELQGSCRCGAVKFSALSHTPYPFMRCYCTICRKVDGCGGYAINIVAQADSLKVEGREHLQPYRVMLPGESGGALQPRTNTRFFCKECGCHLWAQDPSWPQVGPGPAHLPTGTGSLLGTALLPLGRLCHACPASPSLSGTLRRPSCPTFWWVYPFAGAIDTELPALPRSVHMMLAYKADWVKPQVGPQDDTFEEYPELGIEEWHKLQGLWVE